MTTKAEFIIQLKAEHPTLRVGDETMGYTDLSPTDYAVTIEAWADNQLAAEAKAADAEQSATDKTALLAKLGITADEAKLLLS